MLFAIAFVLLILWVLGFTVFHVAGDLIHVAAGRHAGQGGFDQRFLAFASFAVHPVEAFLTFVPVLGMMSTAMPVWAHAYAVWTLSWALLNLYLHSGHELALVEMLLAPLGINTSGFHNSHHELISSNYGELLYIWDVIFDTGFHPGKYRLPCGRKTLSRR